MTINQRASIDGVEVDVVSTGRFYDFLSPHKGRWTLVRRQPIYEKDRLDVVDPVASPALDPELLRRLPTGYRHLGYLQTKTGFTAQDGPPVLTGTAVQRLYSGGLMNFTRQTLPQRVVFSAGESPATVAAEIEALDGSKVMLIASDRQNRAPPPFAAFRRQVACFSRHPSTAVPRTPVRR